MSTQEQISDSETYSSPSPSPSERPNRYTGPPSTYLSLIEQERGLTTSLDQIRDQDLSIHLYNAHALKRRSRQFWERKGKGEEFDEEGEGMGWAPGKGWTAWPLPAAEVPRDGEVVGEDDGVDAFAFRRRGGLGDGPSRELEEIMVGVTLRLARERFEGREWAGSDEEMENETPAGDLRVKAADHVHGADFEQSDAWDGKEKYPEPFTKERSESPEPTAWLRPVISADDERSAEILQPSIRHTLSKLDEVLMALHHARETCHQYGTRSTADTDDETVKGDDSDTPARRPRGRPRKLANLSLLQKENNIIPVPVHGSAELFRAKKTHLGRPQKVYERLEGENQQDYVVRIARLQKKPLPVFAPPPPPSISSPRSLSVASERPRKSPARRATSEELKVSRQKKLGLRDWSEVLGSAALVGLPPDVITRATRRCADLFGEGMTMMTLPEAPVTDKDKDFITKYQPESIPDFGPDEESSNEVSDESEIMSSRSISRSRKRKFPAELAKKSWFCPIENCKRENKGFEYVSGLRRHLSHYHQMAEDDIDEMLDDGEEMDGAVHIDGFLKPMIEKRGVRGTDKGPRKGKTLAKRNTDFDDVDNDEEENEGSSSSVLDDEGGDMGGNVGSDSE